MVESSHGLTESSGRKMIESNLRQLQESNTLKLNKVDSRIEEASDLYQSNTKLAHASQKLDSKYPSMDILSEDLVSKNNSMLSQNED